MSNHPFENHGSEHVQAGQPFRNESDQRIPTLDEIYDKNKKYLLRWMFFFWITTMITILAGYFIE